MLEEDAPPGRIYLPVEDLQRFNVPADDILNHRETPAFRELMLFQIERAEQFYAQALAQLPKVDRKPQRPGLMMAAIYRAAGRNSAATAPEKVLNQRLSLTPICKLWLGGKPRCSSERPPARRRGWRRLGWFDGGGDVGRLGRGHRVRSRPRWRTARAAGARAPDGVFDNGQHHCWALTASACA